MTMVIKTSEEKKAFAFARQLVLRNTSDVVDQLVEQLIKTREELAIAKAEYFVKIEATKSHFDAQVAAMRKEMDATLSMMTEMKLTLIDSPSRRTDTVQ
jgi:hypothetical protein